MEKLAKQKAKPSKNIRQDIINITRAEKAKGFANKFSCFSEN